MYQLELFFGCANPDDDYGPWCPLPIGLSHELNYYVGSGLYEFCPEQGGELMA